MNNDVTVNHAGWSCMLFVVYYDDDQDVCQPWWSWCWIALTAMLVSVNMWYILRNDDKKQQRDDDYHLHIDKQAKNEQTQSKKHLKDICEYH